MTVRKCSTCPAELPPQQGPGRPRTQCKDCAPVRRKKPLAPVADLPAATTTDRVSLYASTLARLTTAELTEDPSGIAALILAEQLDLRSDSGASLAALARQHSLSLAEAMSHAKVEADPVERLLRSVAEKSS